MPVDTPKPDHSFPRAEKLKSRKQIEHLFEHGAKVKAYPLMLAYVEHKGEPREAQIQMGFSVSKRKFKRAVDRNRVKRLMREAYRKQKTGFISASEEHGYKTDAMLIFIGREMPVYSELERKITALLQRWESKLLQHATHDSNSTPSDPPPGGA